MILVSALTIQVFSSLLLVSIPPYHTHLHSHSSLQGSLHFFEAISPKTCEFRLVHQPDLHLSCISLKMGKRKEPDTPLFDPNERQARSLPPQSQAKKQQTGLASPPASPPTAPPKQQGRPTTSSESDPRKAFSFRLDSTDAPQPVTFFETNTRGLNPWSFSRMPGVTVTICAPPQPKSPGKKAEVPVTSSAPVLKKISALPEIVEKKVVESPKAAKAAPVKPVVEAQAPAAPSLEAVKAVPVPSATHRAPPSEIAPVQTQQWVGTPTFVSQFESGLGQLVAFSTTDTASWEHLIGYYFQESGRSPFEVAFKSLDGSGLQHPVQGLGKWSRDWRKVDEWEKNPTVADRWPQPTAGSIVAHLLPQVVVGFRQQILEEAIRRWAMSNPCSVERVVRRAGYMLKFDRPREFSIMSDIKKMAEGAEKERLVAHARQESPRFAEECMSNEYCGM